VICCLPICCQGGVVVWVVPCRGLEGCRAGPGSHFGPAGSIFHCIRIALEKKKNIKYYIFCFCIYPFCEIKLIILEKIAKVINYWQKLSICICLWEKPLSFFQSEISLKLYGKIKHRGNQIVQDRLKTNRQRENFEKTKKFETKRDK
jgi:hypothetical protein